MRGVDTVTSKTKIYIRGAYDDGSMDVFSSDLPRQRIVCVSRDDICRGPIIAALVEEYGYEHDVPLNPKHPESAGTMSKAAKGQLPRSLARSTMLARIRNHMVGPSIDSHKSQWLDLLDLLPPPDLIITVGEEEKAAAAKHFGANGSAQHSVMILNASGGGIPDPFSDDLDRTQEEAQEAYEIMRNLIETELWNLLDAYIANLRKAL